MLGMPGGFVDHGETAEVALKREVLEEIGLRVRSFEYLTSQPNAYVYRGITLPVLDLFYTVEVEDGPIELIDGEITSWIWTELSDHVLDQMAFVSNRAALKFYRDLRKDND
jgi:NADH pyrophosphatase NudC (nudix superfamily)